MVLFLLNDVPTQSSLSTLELFVLWQKKYNIHISSPFQVKELMEYLDIMREFDRDILLDAAKFDGFSCTSPLRGP